MSANRGLFVALNGTIGTTPSEARLALAGLIAENAPGVPRSGLLFQSATSVVAGTSGMSYSLAPCHPVVARSVNDGVYVFSLTGTTTIGTTAAPATGSRWDLIFVKQNDTTKGDADNLPLVGVVQGVAASTPSKPYGSIPEGALVLAEAQVFAGATATNAAGVTITQVWKHTALRGEPIPVRNTTERAEITAFVGARILRLDYAGMEQTFNGSKWYGSVSVGGTYSIPGVPNGVNSGNIDVTFPFTLPGAPAVTVSPENSRLTGMTILRTANGFRTVFDNKSGGYAAPGTGTYVATFTLT